MRGLPLRIALLALALGGNALAQTTPGDRPPERNGPEWGGQNHQPNPADVEARVRVRGQTVAPQDQPAQDRQGQQVDQIYRRLTGEDPAAPPRSTPGRDADRR